MYDLDAKIIGKRLRELRSTTELSLRNFAPFMDMHYIAIMNLENGKNFPSLQTLLDYCNYFNITIDEIIQSNKELKLS